MQNTILWGVVALFPVSEIALALFKRTRRRQATLSDRGSMRLLWLVITISVGAAIGMAGLPVAQIQMAHDVRQVFALAVLLLGLAIRWISIFTLGRFFTVDVSVQQDHHLIETGLYRYVRHPSYAGLLLAFFGLGLFFGNWFSVGVLVLPITGAILWRIQIEERALRDALGESYRQYCLRTKKLIPGVF